MNKRATDEPRRRYLGLIGLTVILVTPLNSCVVTPEDCDPSNSKFGMSLLCQDEYAERQKQLRKEVENAANDAEKQEKEMDALSREQATTATELGELENRARIAAGRIADLRQDSQVSETELLMLERRIESFDMEVVSLQEEQSQGVGSNNPALTTRLEALRAEESELEALLLDLES